MAQTVHAKRISPDRIRILHSSFCLRAFNSTPAPAALSPESSKTDYFNSVSDGVAVERHCHAAARYEGIWRSRRYNRRKRASIAESSQDSGKTAE